MTHFSAFGRMIFAFVTAAMASAAVGALLLSARGALWYPETQFSGLAAAVFAIGFFIALLHAMVLAMPLYAALSGRWPLTLPAALAGSVSVAVIPWVVLFAAIAGDDPDWLPLALSVAWLGLSGAGGGLVFWGLMRDEPARRC